MNTFNHIKAVLLLLIFVSNTYTQNFTRQDTLMGSITPERIWWDLQYYHLNILVDPSEKIIAGENTIRYKVLETNRIMQIDLQQPMNITNVIQDDDELKFNREGNVFYVHLKKPQIPEAINDVKIIFGGTPTEAVMAPWVGGISWKKDKNGNHFVASSCQSEGASIWWPCKDHMYDEPDSMLISVTNPSSIINVSNGRLRSIEKNTNGTTTSHWFVSNPINNYGVNINIGDYTHFNETYEGEKGELDCNYYVLTYNLEKARSHFSQVSKMLEAFEYWFGPYPFYEDGYKLVETPYLGMEHQSSVTYGNGYKNGFGGRDLSGSGWGMKFDFIIVHESGHEWFANSITYKDVADMWIHEGFAAYSENLYVDYHFGKDACNEYVQGTRQSIKNDKPIIGHYGVRSEGSGDMYSKGANMLHTLRQIIDNDDKWRNVLRKINSKFYHQTVNTEQIELFLIEELSIDLAGFFDQYLRDVRIPKLEYKFSEGNVKYRWNDIVDNFYIPVKVEIDDEQIWIEPTNEWQNLKCSEQKFSVDPNFYIVVDQIN